MAGDTRWNATEYGKRNVAAHRQASDHGAVDPQRIHETPDVVGVVVHGGRPFGSKRGAPEASQVRRHEPPAVGHAIELRTPHLGGQGKRMNQDRRPTGTRLEVSRPTAIDNNALVGHEGMILSRKKEKGKRKDADADLADSAECGDRSRRSGSTVVVLVRADGR
jgi:hypothetical protein